MLRVCWNCADAARSRTEILDFNRFKSDLLTPDYYVETAKELYDEGGEADECPPYMVIYDDLRCTCKEQRSIIYNSIDLSVLSSAFIALPRLTDVGRSFCDAIGEDDWVLPSFISGMIAVEESYEYHVRVVSDAIQGARHEDVAIHTISLLGLNLPYCSSWEVPSLSTLSESLRKLLEPIQVLRIIRSSSSLELLSHCALDLHRLDMCSLVTEYNALESFLEINKRSINSIGFHNVRTSGQGHLQSTPSEFSSKLSSSMLCQMLKVPQSTPCRAADCGCLLFRKEGWRLFLHNNHLQQS